MAREIGIRRIQCFGDSNLVVQQVSGNWDAKDANMASYRFHVQQISGYFEGCEFIHLRREDNQAADMLSKLGSSRRPIPPGVSLEHLRKPSIKPDPNSGSIFVPDQPKTDDDPMDVDAVRPDPGTVESGPGTVGSHPGTVGSDPEATVHNVSVEMIAAISNWVDR